MQSCNRVGVLWKEKIGGFILLSSAFNQNTYMQEPSINTGYNFTYSVLFGPDVLDRSE